MKWSMPATTLFIASLGIVSCKSSTPVASAVKSEGFSCDLQSSGAASDAASQKAFQCAYNSLKSAGKLAGGGIVTDVANVVRGVKDVYDASTAAYDLFNEINEFVGSGGVMPIDLQNLASDTSAIVTSTQGVVGQTEFGKQIKRKAMYRCLDGNYKAVKDLVSLAGVASNLQGQSQLSIQGIQSLGGLGLSSVKAIIERMGTLAECSQWLAGERSKSLVQLSKGIESIASSLEIALTLTNCGVDLAYGGYVLYANSACLAQDIQSYYEGRDRLDSQRDNFVNSAIPVQDDYSGVRACMAKYGIHLYNNGPGEFYNTRSYMCALYCGNNGRGMNYMQANMDSIYPVESDRNYCQRVATTAQDSEMVNACIVYCCDQDGSCRDAAWDKLRYRDL
jgi:hypothetical protein